MRSEFQESVEAVSQLLKQLKVGSIAGKAVPVDRERETVMAEFAQPLAKCSDSAMSFTGVPTVSKSNVRGENPRLQVARERSTAWD